METDILHLLVYLAMAGCLLAVAMELLRARRAGGAMLLVGFVIMVAAVVVRWRTVGHVPLQSLFEVFLAMGAAAFPMALLWRRLELPGRWLDPALIAVLLLPTGFIFSAEPRMLPPALQHWLFIPHVAAYVLADVLLLRGGLAAAATLGVYPGLQPDERLRRERVVAVLIGAGFPLLTIGLLLGAWWGKIAWGDYWNWDPKEMWSLATWLVVVGYFHVRRFFPSRRLPALILAVLAALAAVATLLWVNLAPKLFAGLHAYS